MGDIGGRKRRSAQDRSMRKGERSREDGQTQKIYMKII